MDPWLTDYFIVQREKADEVLPHVLGKPFCPSYLG